MAYFGLMIISQAQALFHHQKLYDQDIVYVSLESCISPFPISGQPLLVSERSFLSVLNE